MSKNLSLNEIFDLIKKHQVKDCEYIASILHETFIEEVGKRLDNGICLHEEKRLLKALEIIVDLVIDEYEYIQANKTVAS